MMNQLKHWVSAAGLALASTLLASAALAQAAPDKAEANTLTEVLVTAERREEKIQDVPVAVLVVTTEQLTDRSVDSVQDLSKLSPSLTVQSSAGAVSPFLRGVGSAVQGPGQFGSVATYVDDVYTGEAYYAAPYLDEVEQIQILSGPQGALYGRNATGGAILISTHTPRPGDPFVGKVRAGFGNYGSQSYKASLSGSLGDKAAAYLSASRDTRDGYFKNINPVGLASANHKDFGDRDSWSVNGAFTVQPTDKLSFVLHAGHSYKNDRDGITFEHLGLNERPVPGLPLNGAQLYYAGVLGQVGLPPANAAAAAGALVFSNRYDQVYDSHRNAYQNGLLTGSSEKGSFLQFVSTNVSLKAVYKFNAFDLTSVTGYAKGVNHSAVAIVQANPATLAIPGSAVGFTGDIPSNSIQQQVQLVSTGTGGTQWVAGANYFKAKGEPKIAGDFVGISVPSAFTKWQVKSASAYGQATIPLADAWSTTVGARYTKETYDVLNTQGPPSPKKTLDGSRVTYTARLQWDNGPLLVYGGVFSGFKGGSLSASNTASTPVNPETITSFETGFKWTASPSFLLNGAAFHYKYKNIHISLVDQATGATNLVNGPAAKVTGLELQSSLRVSDWLGLRANGTVLKTEYLADVSPPTGTVGLLRTKGKRLTGAPEHVFAIGADANFNPSSNGKLRFTVDANFNGGVFTDVENAIGSGGTNAGSYTTVDASLTYEPVSSKWSASLYGVNLTDEQYYIGGLVFGGIDKVGFPAAPRTVGLRFQVKF
jgi:iron complex outermembrane receptor protein